jgi:cellulose synthase/poly-beta-1,6-N-acetylglucosamine synthase-like glycosyltransferase/spore germination protein YaaH/peptidoglycan/xylan/chitin deacetylase (PgdA/CDA1 family)
MSASQQIFQSKDPARWKRFKWTSRIFITVVLFFFIVAVLAVVLDKSPSGVKILNSSETYKGIVDGTKPLSLQTERSKKYKGFKEFLLKKQKEDSLKNFGKQTQVTKQFIRAAFYTPWSGSTSVPSLTKQGDKLNVIFPEWFFIDTLNTTGLQTRVDSEGLATMRKLNLRIIPILTNFNSSKKDFDGQLIHTILNNPKKQQSFIQSVIDTLMKYNFAGINIDFEDLIETNNNLLVAFQQNLYRQLHAKNLLVTQDIAPFNNDYKLEELGNYNDYIILMAYDQNNGSTAPGPISDQKWIEQALDNMASKIENSKIILGFAGFGYDWQEYTDEEGVLQKECNAITYAEAIDMAKLSGAIIDYDNNSYNLHYSYEEDFVLENSNKKTKIKHTIWFTDGATTFNILRFADEYGIAGTVLWRLGSEDPRIWTYYERELNNEALSHVPFNFNSIATIPINPNQKPTGVGQGELLNILFTPQEGKISFDIDSAEQIISEQTYQQLPSGYVYQKFAEDTVVGKGHKLILTFDDGPGDEYTSKILDILEKEKVPATFFVVGLNAEKNIPILRRINKDGFEIGNHTFTHNNMAKMTTDRAEVEMKSTRLLIEAVTGRSTILFRAPYNADSEPQTFEEIEPLVLSKKDNYITVGESVDPNDWDERSNADSIVNRTIKQVEERNANIILLHDAGGKSRQATVDAVPRIIKYFKEKGYKFTTIADLMGKTKDDVMPPVKKDWNNSFNFIFVEALYWGGMIIFALFLFGIFLSVARIFFMASLAWLQKRQEQKVLPFTNNMISESFVSIIVPAYNEEVNAVRTVTSLLKQDYKNLQIIFVDDGSKDQTYKVVSEAFQSNDKVKVFTKPNGGKASALNFGIEHAAADYVVCIDADTQLKTNAVRLLMNKFENEKTGAVAGNVKVGNEVNMITRWQSIEYITSQNFDRRAFDYLNCITVVPGALGAFNKNAVREAGGFTTDTLAEDCDLTMRLQKKGYVISNCNEAISYTEAPETMTQFMKQRFRWSFGVMQCFWKHRDALFNPRFKNFGMIALPHILIYQMVLPFLAPLADLILVLSLIASAVGIIPVSGGHILLYYLIFTIVDMAGAALAFNYEKEDYKKLVWMIPQRFIYRQLMYYILFKSFNRAIKGELQGWGVLKRTGNVKEVVTT